MVGAARRGMPHLTDLTPDEYEFSVIIAISFKQLQQSFIYFKGREKEKERE